MKFLYWKPLQYKVTRPNKSKSSSSTRFIGLLQTQSPRHTREIHNKKSSYRRQPARYLRKCCVVSYDSAVLVVIDRLFITKTQRIN